MSWIVGTRQVNIYKILLDTNAVNEPFPNLQSWDSVLIVLLQEGYFTHEFRSFKFVIMFVREENERNEYYQLLISGGTT